MSPELQKLVNEFAESRRARLDTPDGAYCMCDSTSDAFILFARERNGAILCRYDFELDDWVVDKNGVGQTIVNPRNPKPELYQRGKHPVAEFHRAGWHAIVDAGDCLIDFTARQYHQDAEYPTIIAKKAAAAAAGGN